METIVCYSYKGGVGRSLLLANMARYLTLLGHKVVAMDLDLESPGLHYKLPPKKPLDNRVGVVPFILEHRRAHAQAEETGEAVNSPLRRLESFLSPVAVDHLVGAEYRLGELHLFAAGNAPSADYFDSLARIDDWRDFFFEEGGQQFFNDLKQGIAEDLGADFLLVDARTGITETGGFAIHSLADKLVLLTHPNEESLGGIAQVLSSLERLNEEPEGAPEPYLMLSRLQHGDADIERLKNDVFNRLAPKGPTLLKRDHLFVTHHDPALAGKILTSQDEQLIGGSSRADDRPLLGDYLRLLVKLISRERATAHFDDYARALRHRFLGDPDKVEAEIEQFAELTADYRAYRLLLQVYKARKVGADKLYWAMRKARELDDPDDDGVLARSFVETFTNTSGHRLETVDLQYALALWESKKQIVEPEPFGAKLVDALIDADTPVSEDRSNLERALEILDGLIDPLEPDERLILKSLQLLRRAKWFDEAVYRAQAHGKERHVSDRFLEEWAKSVVALGNQSKAGGQLILGEYKERLTDCAPWLVAELMRLFRGETYAIEHLALHLQKAIQARDEMKIIDLGGTLLYWDRATLFDKEVAKLGKAQEAYYKDEAVGKVARIGAEMTELLPEGADG